ncbi:MAG: hypothetical protein ACXADY_07265 [Candidatus Hodarchaeales archaeon]|jgi:hypothetical protein
MSRYSSFLEPTIPSLIVGRQDYEERFETILSRFKDDNFKRNLVIISGSPGIGKSSILGLYSEIIKREKLSFTQPTVQMGKLNQNLFQEIYRMISPHLEQEKKGFLQKSKEVRIRSVTSDLHSPVITNNFVLNLQARSPKVPIVIALDSIDRILDSGYKYVLDILRDLISTLRGKFPIFFIIIIQEYHTENLKDFIQMGEHIVVDRLNFEDSKLLMSKIAKGQFQTSNRLYETFIKQSDRSPFNLVFISEVIAWAKEKMKNEGFNENESTIKELAQPFIRNFALRAFIQEIFTISEEEDKAIQFMLDYSKNLFHKRSLHSSVSKNGLEKLRKKGLIVKEGDYYQFSSYALFSSLGLGTRVIDRTVEVQLLLTVLEGDVLKKIDISPNVLERLEQIAYSTGSLEDQLILNRTKALYSNVIDQKKYYEAFRLALLTGNLFRIADDANSSGKFFEECAQSFYYRRKVNYATALYRKALEAFHIADNKGKFRDVARRAAQIYLQQAEGYINQNHLEFARTAYYHSIEFYKQSEDFNSASETAKKAIQTYKKSVHAEYFKKLVAAIEPFAKEEALHNE